MTNEATTKEYPVLTVSKAKLMGLGYSDEVVNSLTEDDMRKIAEYLYDRYLRHMKRFEANIRDCVGFVLQEKSKE